LYTNLHNIFFIQSSERFLLRSKPLATCRVAGHPDALHHAGIPAWGSSCKPPARPADCQHLHFQFGQSLQLSFSESHSSNSQLCIHSFPLPALTCHSLKPACFLHGSTGSSDPSFLGYLPILQLTVVLAVCEFSRLLSSLFFAL
jgi:hypothetical protein